MVHAGHGFLHAEGFRQQAGQDVRFLVARYRDEGVHLINMLFLQEGLVRAVAVQDQRTLQLVRQLFAALLADVDELGVHALVLKEPRQTQADVPAAHDAGRAEAAPRLVQRPQQCPLAGGLVGEIDGVPRLDDVGAGRDDELLSTAMAPTMMPSSCTISRKRVSGCSISGPLSTRIPTIRMNPSAS